MASLFCFYRQQELTFASIKNFDVVLLVSRGPINNPKPEPPTYNMDKEKVYSNNNEQEIDLLELGRKLWSKRRLIIRYSIYGFIAGVIISFSIPKEYTTSILMTPETSDSKNNMGSMAGLASLAGINLGTAERHGHHRRHISADHREHPFSDGVLQYARHHIGKRSAYIYVVGISRKRTENGMVEPYIKCSRKDNQAL